MKFEIHRSKSISQPYYWRIVATNGQVLASSETYVSKQGCQNAIATVKTSASSAPILDLS